MPSMTAELKISRSLTKLAIHHPFFGAVAFRLNILEDAKTKTMSTNGKCIKWGRAFVDDMTEEETMGVIVHEIYHVVLKHHLRRGDRDNKRWNYAADLCINPMVTEGGFDLPVGGLFDKRYDGKWMTERVYEDLPEMASGGCPWGEVEDLTNEDGSNLSDTEAHSAEMDIDEVIQMAADQARKAGKLPANISEIVSEMAESQIRWEDKFQRFAGGSQPDDYSRRRYSKRTYAAFGAFAPTVEKVGVGNVGVGWDISGSVSSKEFTHFKGELNAFIEDCMPESVTIVFCDTKVRSVTYLSQGETLGDVEITGRGGTRVEPVFDYFEEQGIELEKLVYLTDMGFSVDAEKVTPHYPVMWLSTLAGQEPPFGEIAYVKV